MPAQVQVIGNGEALTLSANAVNCTSGADGVITVTNNGASNATNVSVTITIPPGGTITNDTPSQGSYLAGVWTVGTLTPSQSETLDLEFTVSDDTLLPFDFTYTVTHDDAPDNVLTNDSNCRRIDGISCTDLQGCGDTNLATADATADADHTHDFATFNQTWNNLGTFDLNLDDLDIDATATVDIAGATSIYLDSTGQIYGFGDGAGANLPTTDNGKEEILRVDATDGRVYRSTQLQSGNIFGLTENQIVYADATGNPDQSANLTFDDATLLVNVSGATGTLDLGGTSAAVLILQETTTNESWTFTVNTGGMGLVSSADDILTISGSGADVLELDTSDGSLRLNSYGSGTLTGVETQLLSLDTNGNVIETDQAGGLAFLGLDSFTNGSVLVANVSGDISEDSNLFWVAGSSELQVGSTGTPPAVASIQITSTVQSQLEIDDGTALWRMVAVSGDLEIRPTVNGLFSIGNALTANKLTVDTTDGSLTFNDYGSGTFADADDAYVLSVDATGNVQEMDAADLAAFLGSSTENIYTTDGSISDPTRTVTLGANTVLFTGSDNVVQVNSTSGAGINALQVSATAGGAGIFTATGGTAVLSATNNGGAGSPLQATANPASTTGLVDVATFLRTTTGTAANDIGGSLRFRSEDDGGTASDVGYLDFALSTVTAGSEVGEIIYRLANGAGGLNTVLSTIGNTGQLSLPQYGSGTLTDTAAYFLAVNATGDVFEADGTDAAAFVDSATTTAKGVVELATTAEIDAASSADLVMTPDLFRLSDYGVKEFTINVYNIGTDVDTTTGIASITIPNSADGMILDNVVASVHTLGTSSGSETIDVQVVRRRGGSDVNMLSTAVTLDKTEYFAQDGTIDAANDDVQAGDMLFPTVTNNLDTTDATGMSVTLEFRKP